MMISHFCVLKLLTEIEIEDPSELFGWEWAATFRLIYLIVRIALSTYNFLTIYKFS